MDITRQKWELQSGEVLETTQVFSKIITNEIDTKQMCRTHKQNWQPIAQVFRFIKDYGILCELGQGAFGKVYLGIEINKDQTQHRLVAIKKPTQSVIQQYAQESENQIDEMKARIEIGDMFACEATCTAQLAICPYVVNVIDQSVAEPYLVLEYCNGGTLAQRMTQSYTENDIIRWGYQIASGLAAAHGLQPDPIIHRDLKPQNILLHNGNIKISDFGTSKRARMAESLRSLKGGYTPKYASPEAVNGQAYPATDIWSFGVMMYRLISGQFPFVGENMAQLVMKITCHNPTPLYQCRKLDVDAAICSLIDACLNKDVTARPSALQCSEAFSQGMSVQTTPQPQVPTDLNIQKNSQNVVIEACDTALSTSKKRALQTIQNAPSTRTAKTKARRQNKKNPLLFYKILGTLGVIGVVFGIFLTVSDTQKSTNTVSKKKIKPKRNTRTHKQPTREIKQTAGNNTKPTKKTVKEISQLSLNKFIGNPQQYGFSFLRKHKYSSGGINNTMLEYQHDTTGIDFVLIDFKKPYLIAKYEMTQGTWQKFMGQNPAQFSKEPNYKEYPVEKVSWLDAQKFCKKFGFDLPTEEQWRYACRSRVQKVYYWGDRWTSGKVVSIEHWLNKVLKGPRPSTIDEKTWQQAKRSNPQSLVNVWKKLDWVKEKTVTMPVGSFEPNAFGLYDTLGNVWELCNGIGSNGTTRLICGGAWDSWPQQCVYSFALYVPYTDRRNNIGFRPVQNFVE